MANEQEFNATVSGYFFTLRNFFAKMCNTFLKRS